MEHYYTPIEFVCGNSLSITGDEAKHLSKVLRKKTGEQILVTDGDGNLYKVQIASFTKNSIECSIIEKLPSQEDAKFKIILFQSLLKNPSRFEFVIEKATELGVSKIVPMITQNVINPKHDKTERWQSIALSAMKQSQRCYLPKVETPILFEEAMKTKETKLIAHEKNSNYSRLFWRRNIVKEETFSLFIGPEGGFTAEEIELAKESGAEIISLGTRKFRSETAAILSIGLILYNP